MSKKSDKKSGKKSDKSSKKNRSSKKSRSVTATPAVPGPDVSAIQETRRTKLRAAREAATATAELAVLDEQMEVTNAELRELDARRAAAEQHLLSLHDAIGTAQLTRTRIRSERKQARGRAVTAREKATDAERSYDSAVLSQLLDSAEPDRSDELADAR